MHLTTLVLESKSTGCGCHFVLFHSYTCSNPLNLSTEHFNFAGSRTHLEFFDGPESGGLRLSKTDPRVAIGGRRRRNLAAWGAAVGQHLMYGV